MEPKFLEDIVREEERALKLNSRIRRTVDSLPIRHPILSSTLLYATLELLSQKFPELRDLSQIKLPVSYTYYLAVGIIKEYIVEGRSPIHKNKNSLVSWFLHNPKIAAPILALAGYFIGKHGEAAALQEIYRVDDPLDLPLKERLEVYNHAISGYFLTGVLAESISRGISNLRRIKRSVKKLKTSLKEKACNFLFEHPFALSAAATATTFAYVYLSPSTRVHAVSPSSKRIILTGNLLEDLVEHPAKITHIGLEAGLVGLLALGTTLAAGSLLHSHSLRETSYRVKRLFHSLKGNTEAEIAYQKALVALPNSREKTIEEIVNLGNTYYEQGHRTEAFKQYRRALRVMTKTSDQLSYADLFRRTYRDTIRKLKRKFSRKKDPEEDTINKMFVDLLNKDTKALDGIKGLVDENPTDSRLRYVYGKALEIIGYRESAEIQKIKAVQDRLKEGIPLEYLEGTKNKVGLFKDDVLLGDEVVAKSADLEKLKTEKRATEEVREAIKHFDNYDVPIPIGIVRHEGRFFYVMEQASGELLADRIREGKATEEEFYQIAHFMGLIHAKVTEVDGERDYRETIRTRLRDSGVPAITTQRIVNSLRPTISSLNSIERVPNRDGHPRNWLLDEFGGIVGLDLEMERLVPLTCDTANLVNQHKTLTEDQQDKILVEHLNSYTEHEDMLGELPLEEYRLAFLNSIIIRGLEIYSQVKDNSEILSDSLANARDAIKKIERDFPRYYETNQTDYETLHKEIEVLNPH